MLYFFYKNSVLATICSMIGAAFATTSAIAMFNGELEVMPGIVMLAISFGLMYLARKISNRKAMKKQAQNAADAGASSVHTAQPQYTAPAQPARTASAPAAHTYAMRSCPHCHQLNPNDSVFCAGCGKRMTAEPIRPEAKSSDASSYKKVDEQELKKKIQACKELLDCGLLSQKEYDQKIQELKRR